MAYALEMPQRKRWRPNPRTRSVDCPGMGEDLRTPAVVQRYLDDLHGESRAEPIVRELLSHAAGRLRILCVSMLTRDYSRLTRPPLNLQADEMLSGLVERLLKAMEQKRPPTVRQFNQWGRQRGPSAPFF